MMKAEVSELIIDSQSGIYGLGLAAEKYDANKTRYLRITDIDDNGFLLNDDKKSVSSPDIDKYILKENDLVVARTGNSTGRTYMHNAKNGILAYAGFLIKYVIDDKKINPRYLKYYTLSKTYKDQINAFVGSTRGTMSASDFKTIIVYYPDRKTQDGLVDLFDNISDKIENNNAITAELESMAKTIYNYWFLQFEFPNEEGKPFKSSGGKMVWNEELKREIPEGWEVSSVKKCIQHINTGLNPRDNFQLGKGNIKYITVKNLTTKGTIDFSDCDMIDEAARSIVHKRSDVSKGDILFASIAPLGRCVIVQETPNDWDINESVFSIRPNYEKVSSEYLYMYFMSDSFIRKAEHSSTGSVFNGIRISTLEDMPILVPNAKVNDAFKEVVTNILMKKYANQEENQELISLRDFLFPLFMNGQVDFEEEK